ncbi:ORF1 [Solenopsis invicta virus 9]|nr:ORF1 [Solenopsis invicta virus 9]
MEFTTNGKNTVSIPLPKFELYDDDNMLHFRNLRRYNVNKFKADYSYIRNHPFYNDWSEWKLIASKYHSPNVHFLQSAINKGYRDYSMSDVTPTESFLIDEIYFMCNNFADQMKYNLPMQSIFQNYDYYFSAGPSCECNYDKPNPFKNECVFAQHHLQAIIIAFLWAFEYHVKPRKYIRKYYKRLERVILSLPYKYLINFDLSLIVEPPRYQGRGRNLLRELYDRAYFDKPNFDDMVQRFEYYKHFIKQQGGNVLPTNQSYSEESLFVPGCIDLGLDICKKYEFEEILSKLTPKSQGYIFPDNMTHNVSDESINKFKDMLMESQKSFFEGLKDTIIESGKSLFCMFSVASTVCLLSKAAIGIGASVVLKLLHMIYAMISGPREFMNISKSFVCAKSQSGSDDVSIPFIPTMILNYVINPPKEILTNIWMSNKTDMVMRRIGYLGDVKIERGISRMIEWMNKIILEIKRWYAQEILGIEWNDIESDCHVITKWNEEVDAMLKTYYEGSFVWTDTSFGVVYNLYSRGLRFTREPAYIKYKFDVWKVINKLSNILELFKIHGCANQQIRNPPVVIYIHGDTGAGKSSMTYPVAVEILKGIFQKEKSPLDLKSCWKSLVYMRAPEQEFWDGYENQLVTIFDDFSQMNDSQQNPNLELFEIIRAANCFPYPLHMASIDQKANTTFTSKIIIVSSNLSKPQCASLNFPDALINRFEHAIYVKREKGDKRHSNKFDPSLYRLHKYDMKTNKVGESVTYKDMIDMCVDSYFERKDFVSSVEEYINSTLADGEYVNMSQGCQTEENIYEDIEIPQSQAGEVDEFDYHDCIEGCSKEEHQDIEEINNPGDNRIQSNVIRRGKPISEEMLYEIGYQQRETWRMNREYGIDHIYYNDDGRPRDATWIENKMYNIEDYLEDKFHASEKLTAGVDYLVDKSKICFDKCRSAVDSLKNRYSEMLTWWESFKSRHSYLNKALIVLSVIAAGLMFLKLFHQMKDMFSTKKQKVITPYEFTYGQRASRAERTACSEAYSAVKNVVPKVEGYSAAKVQVPKTESYSNVKVQVPKTEGYVDVKQQVPKVESVADSQGVRDINASEILMAVTRRNLYKMYESTQGAAIGHILFLKGKVAIMPKHYLGSLYQSLRNDPEASVYFEAVLLRRSFEIKIKDMLATKKEYDSPDEEDGPVNSRDLMACVINTAIVHMDATAFFATKGSLCRTDCTEVMMPVLIRNNIKSSEMPILQILYAKGRSALMRMETLPVADEGNMVTRYIRDAWQYNLDTQDTMCGSPLIVRNTQITPGKICGIHIAGLAGTGDGWSTPIYLEDVEKILALFGDQAKFVQHVRFPLDEYPKEQGQIPQSAEFLRLGALKKPVAQPAVTKIIPSPLYGKIKEPESKPCILRPITLENGEKWDPRTYRLGRLGNITQAIDEDLIKNAKNAFVDELSTVIAAHEESRNENIKAVYSFEEACLGIDGELFVNSIKRDTSSGFPFIQMPNFTRKDIFGSDEVYKLDTPQCQILKKRCADIIDNAKQGIVLDHYFVDTLKDERKPIHKAHKTRLFSAGAIDYLIVCKQYFNGPVALLSKLRNFSHISVGTNVYSEDWGQIVKILHRKAKNIIAGDFEGFDASQHQRLLEAAGEVLIEISRRFLGATEEDIKVMRVLLVSLFNSMHICGKEVVQWTHSLPSGHYLTAIINSIFVNLAFCIVWMLAFGVNSYFFARKFWKECGIVAYGDDHLVSVPDSRLEKFNQIILPYLMSLIGLGYTMEDKDACATEKSRLITDVSYLKRKFLFDKVGNRWLCPLSLSTVLEFPMWVRKCPDPNAQTIVELEKAIQELSLHDEETWCKWLPVLRRCGEELGHYTDLLDQEEVRLVATSLTDLL